MAASVELTAVVSTEAVWKYSEMDSACRTWAQELEEKPLSRPEPQPGTRLSPIDRPSLYRALFNDDVLLFVFPQETPAWNRIEGLGLRVGP